MSELVEMRAPKNEMELVCWKIWGGNARAETPFTIPGMKGVLHSAPYRDSDAGGDLYFMSACGSGAIGRICIADVSGHGKERSPVSQWLESAFGRQIHRENARSVLEAVNRQAVESDHEAVSTAICASYNSLNGRFQYCYAGHPYIRIWRNGSDRWDELSHDLPETGDYWNVPLGFSKDARYLVGTTELTPGDRLILYTDGLIEARDLDENQVGESIWQLMSLEDTPAQQLRTLLSSLGKHIGPGRTLNDDMTILILEIQPYQSGNKYSLFFHNQLLRRLRHWLRTRKSRVIDEN